MTEVATSDQLFVVIDPVARRTDGESVRIAKDVLSAGARTKVCLPDGPEEFARALARRGSRRPVVIGDDRALLRTVALLHRQRELAGCALSVVPVGASGVLSLTRSLGVPTGAVAAARAVLEGAERRLDLLVDDSDGVVVGAVRIPAVRGPGGGAVDVDAVDGVDSGEASRPWLRSCRSLVRTLAVRPVRGARVAPPAGGPGPRPSRLRVEVDGVTLVDLDQPVQGVTLTPGAPGAAGGARVEVRPVSVGAEASPLGAVGVRVTVSGADFRYRVDAGVVSGPVRRRTWVVREGAWGLTLPG
ncbi:diacylglycerol kinase [Streptomyces sp. NPDC047042]|uniref:diacylglycerol kinase n=1 Tax=Streptomyces sp. NPDC047042 TaxID=3154807 RepID=UPI0033F6B2DA